ncbi:hypothetical protein SteCoe_11377 [Stentor coeruleus]|uniref:dolichyl-diphosphooligosaccharide--protein glycotransferase n=1 Tax=Stentor coeruleus TaxID=5963 RepID=A0A1R2CD95_9CILI|nr:hypothetical protein SteCoe_11377 [Stentor coeruleus]
MESGVKGLLENWSPVFRIIILAMICILSVLIRVFSVIRFESIIHEFDPWFNFRTTKYLTERGVYAFWDWFDAESWFPLGRAVGGTIYPGIMLTAGLIHSSLHTLGFPIDIRNVCVFLAPGFAALTSLAGYFLTKEVTGRSEAGLYAALFVGIVPSYISRSVAGSYDNEGVAIFALVFTFYLYIKSVNTGSLLWSAAASLSFFYMVAAWGGYAFIINIIPIFVVGSVLIGKFTTNLYVSYCSFYILGSLLAMQIPFVGTQVVTSSEHLASHAVFVFLQIYVLGDWIKERAGEAKFKFLIRFLVTGAVSVVVIASLYMTLSGKMKWSGRSMSLLDPTYAKKFIPIIASVSEHQPTTWSSFFFDLHFLTVFAPVGLYFCLMEHNPGKLFIAGYGVLAVYFACVMVRLLLVLAPAVCILSAIGLSETLHRFTRHIKNYKEWASYISSKPSDKKTKPEYGYPLELALVVIGLIGFMSVYYINHCVWVAAEAYSSPTVIMASKGYDGERRIIDDYREAYYWLRMNTAQDARIMSWWDYGYQITGFSNRTVMVDNNTWNNTHIATMGMIFGSNEEVAAKNLRKIDANYVLVIFGGLSYYSGDDINKFLWMIRIAAGVFPQIKEEDYLNRGQYRIDSGMTETMKNSLMYRLCYYRFGEVQGYNRGSGYDVVRNAEIGEKNIKLRQFSEVFTSEHWIVRIYKVLPEENRDTIKPKSTYASRNKEMKEVGLTKVNLS